MNEISVREAAIRLGKRLDDTYKLLHAEKIAGRKQDGVWRVDAASVESYRKNSSRTSLRFVSQAATAVAAP